MKQLLTLLLSFTFVLATAQESKLSLSSITRDNPDKVALDNDPLLELSYQGNSVNLGRVYNLSQLEANWVSTISVLKGQSATAIYGEEGKDGVILVNLKSTPEAKAYFEEEVERMKYIKELGPIGDASNSNYDEQKRNLNFGPVRTRGEFLNRNSLYEKKILYKLILGDENFTTFNSDLLKEVESEEISSITIIKNKKSLEEYSSEKIDGVVEITIDSNKISKNEFKELKRKLKQ